MEFGGGPLTERAGRAPACGNFGAAGTPLPLTQ